MDEKLIANDEFRRVVVKLATTLTRHGFRRAPQWDSETSTTVSISYVGENVAFTFSLDVRDQAIDLLVTRVRDGKLVPTWDGGYSSSLFTHLVSGCGFRGRPVPADTLSPEASRAERILSALVSLLAEPCAQDLLADREDALPR